MSRLHSAIHRETLRKFNSIPSDFTADSLVYPVFIADQPDVVEEIPNLKDQKRVGINRIVDHLREPIENGLKSVIIFGIPDPAKKDLVGSCADTPDSPVVLATKTLAAAYPALLLICDVCLCHYTSHGHCGILTQPPADSDAAPTIDNERSVTRLTQVALNYARAGCHVIAPSDMMDGRVGAIRRALTGIEPEIGPVSILAYSTKFASNFYGPFRSASKCSSQFGNRACYQLPIGSESLALRAAKRDIKEGADFLLVKPGLPYLDIVKSLRDKYPEIPLAVYHVSGEYAMLTCAADAGAIDLTQSGLETFRCFRRAGASIIISYLTPFLLKQMKSTK